MNRVEQHVQRPTRTLMLSGHQPVYLPGIILFNKIARSDMFMFVGHCQYVKKSWHSRNRIRLGDRELWLSVPVETAGRFDQSINNARVKDGVWKRKHLGSIRQAYCRARFFEMYYPGLEESLMADYAGLGDMNIALVKLLCRWLDIRTPLIDSRDYDIQGTKTEMLISMCQAVGATQYLSNEGSRAYVDEDQLAEAGIQHYWQIFAHPVYAQGRGFLANMSAIDLLFHLGPDAQSVVANRSEVVSNHVGAGVGAAANG